MSQPDLHKIQEIGLLKELSESELITLSRVCSWQRYATNEQIIDRQSETNDVFFIIEGKVRVVNYSLSGRVITLDDIGAGGHSESWLRLTKNLARLVLWLLCLVF